MSVYYRMKSFLTDKEEEANIEKRAFNRKQIYPGFVWFESMAVYIFSISFYIFFPFFFTLFYFA